MSAGTKTDIKRGRRRGSVFFSFLFGKTLSFPALCKQLSEQDAGRVFAVLLPGSFVCSTLFKAGGKKDPKATRAMESTASGMAARILKTQLIIAVLAQTTQTRRRACCRRRGSRRFPHQIATYGRQSPHAMPQSVTAVECAGVTLTEVRMKYVMHAA